MSGRTGPPMVSGSYNNNMQLIQTEDHIVILSEMIHYARIIRLDSEHHTRQLKWGGDSVAHWEGDTRLEGNFRKSEGGRAHQLDRRKYPGLRFYR